MIVPLAKPKHTIMTSSKSETSHIQATEMGIPLHGIIRSEPACIRTLFIHLAFALNQHPNAPLPNQVDSVLLIVFNQHLDMVKLLCNVFGNFIQHLCAYSNDFNG